jgi:hypothetical protein
MHFNDFGINLAGYFTAELGLGEIARNYVPALKQLGVELSLQDASFITHQRRDEKALCELFAENTYPLNLVCLNAPEIKHFVEHFGARYFHTKYNIGMWWWEVEEIPHDWQAEFFRFDELWVGSNFVGDNFARVSPIPIIVMPPHVVAHPTGLGRTIFDLSKDEFIFLYTFDFFSCFERKRQQLSRTV